MKIEDYEDVRDGKGTLVPLPICTVADSPYQVGDEVLARIRVGYTDLGRAMGRITGIFPGQELWYQLETFEGRPFPGLLPGRQLDRLG